MVKTRIFWKKKQRVGLMLLFPCCFQVLSDLALAFKVLRRPGKPVDAVRFGELAGQFWGLKMLDPKKIHEILWIYEPLQSIKILFLDWKVRILKFQSPKRFFTPTGVWKKCQAASARNPLSASMVAAWHFGGKLGAGNQKHIMSLAVSKV